MSDAFLAERDAHCVRDAGFARDARLRRVNGTHRITYHSEAASLITYLQAILFCDILSKSEVCIMSDAFLAERDAHLWCVMQASPRLLYRIMV